MLTDELKERLIKIFELYDAHSPYVSSGPIHRNSKLYWKFLTYVYTNIPAAEWSNIATTYKEDILRRISSSRGNKETARTSFEEMIKKSSDIVLFNLNLINDRIFNLIPLAPETQFNVLIVERIVDHLKSYHEKLITSYNKFSSPERELVTMVTRSFYQVTYPRLDQYKLIRNTIIHFMLSRKLKIPIYDLPVFEGYKHSGVTRFLERSGLEEDYNSNSSKIQYSDLTNYRVILTSKLLNVQPTSSYRRSSNERTLIVHHKNRRAVGKVPKHQSFSLNDAARKNSFRLSRNHLNSIQESGRSELPEYLPPPDPKNLNETDNEQKSDDDKVPSGTLRSDNTICMQNLKRSSKKRLFTMESPGRDLSSPSSTVHQDTVEEGEPSLVEVRSQQSLGSNIAETKETLEVPEVQSSSGSETIKIVDQSELMLLDKVVDQEKSADGMVPIYRYKYRSDNAVPDREVRSQQSLGSNIAETKETLKVPEVQSTSPPTNYQYANRNGDPTNAKMPTQQSLGSLKRSETVRSKSLEDAESNLNEPGSDEAESNKNEFGLVDGETNQNELTSIFCVAHKEIINNDINDEVPLQDPLKLVDDHVDGEVPKQQPLDDCQNAGTSRGSAKCQSAKEPSQQSLGSLKLSETIRSKSPEDAESNLNESRLKRTERPQKRGMKMDVPDGCTRSKFPKITIRNESLNDSQEGDDKLEPVDGKVPILRLKRIEKPQKRGMKMDVPDGCNSNPEALETDVERDVATSEPITKKKKKTNRPTKKYNLRKRNEVNDRF